MTEIDRVSQDIEALQGLGVEALRQVWRTRFDDAPPRFHSNDLMRRFIADRLQREAFGFDASVERDLDRLVRDYRAGRSLTPTTPHLGAGVILVREWQGQTHRVEVTAAGYRWRGQTYASLSVIARAITGARWNGPRFFGLREKAKS